MRDPLDELDNFTTPGPTMDPLPASEVRRRGTRMRRRNNALAAIGGVAAVAIIATPLAMAASNDRTDTTPPVTNPSPAVTWVTEIPANFPLTDGMPAGTQQRGSSVVGLLAMCGTTVWNEDIPAHTDVASARHEERDSEGTSDHSLVLYPDAATAAEVFSEFREGVLACPREPGNAAGTQTVNDVITTDLGADESFVFSNQIKDGDLLYDLTTYAVVRSGNAIYLAGSHTSAGGQQVVDGEAERLAEQSATAIDAMCVFSSDPCTD